MSSTYENSNASLGMYGSKTITDTTVTTPSTGYVFTAIQAIEDTVIAEVLGNTSLDGLTLVAGTIVYGIFTSIELTSGTVIAYNAIDIE